MDKLKQGWSPEQISGRLKNQEHAGDKDRQISFEAIYQFVYSEDQAHHQYWQYLRRGHKKRRKQKTGRKVHRSRIPDRVSIHQRPRIVDKRQQPGHWEGDTIVGKGRDHGLHTAYERVSSYIRFEYMDKHDSNSSLDAQLKIYGSLPQHMRRTTTVDNGKEHVKHTMLKQELGMDTYFADPYSSWQRGGNENANLWIRYYFPKRTDFRTIPTAELRAVEWELNNRPRKRLNYQTPQEVFSKLMQQGLRS